MGRVTHTIPRIEAFDLDLDADHEHVTKQVHDLPGITEESGSTDPDASRPRPRRAPPGHPRRESRPVAALALLRDATPCRRPLSRRQEREVPAW